MIKAHVIDVSASVLTQISNGEKVFDVRKIKIEDGYEKEDIVLYRQLDSITDENGDTKTIVTNVIQLCRIKDILQEKEGVADGYCILFLTRI